MSTTSSSEARSEAELRVITIKTESGDPVIFSGNPAELPEVRFETRKALKRAGAFTMLINKAQRIPPEEWSDSHRRPQHHSLRHLSYRRPGDEQLHI